MKRKRKIKRTIQRAMKRHTPQKEKASEKIETTNYELELIREKR